MISNDVICLENDFEQNPDLHLHPTTFNPQHFCQEEHLIPFLQKFKLVLHTLVSDPKEVSRETSLDLPNSLESPIFKLTSDEPNNQESSDTTLESTTDDITLIDPILHDHDSSPEGQGTITSEVE